MLSIKLTSKVYESEVTDQDREISTDQGNKTQDNRLVGGRSNH